MAKAPIKMREKIAAEMKARMDGWKNILTGLGVRGKDRRKASCIEWEPMQEAEADEFYAASDIARKIVDEVVQEAFREGYELSAKDKLTPEVLSAITDEGQRLQVDEKLQEGWTLARMYGGSGIIPIPKDVKLLEKPFIPEALVKIESLLVLSRWELPRQQIETDVRQPNFSRPKTYRICPRTGSDQMNYEVHHSWILRFDGSYLPRIKFFKNNLWNDSILNVCKVPIRDYDAALAAVSATLDDFSVGVMKITGLTRMISEDKDDLITKRLEITNLSRSIAKTIILDAEKEEFEYQDRQLSGVADCVKLIAGRLVVASGMPHTKILGESPAGSNATGNSTTKDWYDHVGSQQENYLDPKLITLWKWILSTKQSPTKGKIPEGLKAVYAPLWQEPESAQATTRYTQAQADGVYIQNGVLDPEEVAVSRFGSGEYSSETQLSDDRKDPTTKPQGGGSKPDPSGASKGKNAPATSNPKVGKSDPEATNALEKKLANV